MADWLIYGANGYHGRLCAEEAVRRGMRPILAGRREDVVRPIAERLGLPWRAFPLDQPERIARQLDGAGAILLAAGPFSATSAKVVEACLRARVHYLDITGEIPVFEACHRRGGEAAARGVVILPGVGFDVVPSDCLAASLKAALPSATRLELAVAGDGGPSAGTAKTMVEMAAMGGAIRKGGVIRRVPLGSRTRVVPFRDRSRFALAIPWGDVATAFYSTGILDIVVYAPAPRRAVRVLSLVRPLLPLLRVGAVLRFVQRRIERRVTGPDEAGRQSARSHLWGRVEDKSGGAVEGTLETPGGHLLTATAAVECMRRVLEGRVTAGMHTPSTAFGAGFIGELPGCDLRVGD
ncbi:MAG: saccharopine dehydrogenase [Myxococcales bacterium]|nr:saccharopine dehydrogenase [Myxococcales bacterium]